MGIGQTMAMAVLADSALAALVDDKVYPLVYPSGVEFPCITYRVISGFRDVVPTERIYTTRIQFDVWSETYIATAEIAAALMVLFDYLNNVVNSQQIITTKVDLHFDTFEQNIKKHRAVVDVRVTHEGE